MKFAIISHLLILIGSCVSVKAGNASTYTYQPSGTEQPFSLALALNTTSNDIFFNMTAPSEYSWFSFGIGSQMKGALMFIGYPSSNGSAITFSPRLATGNKQPLYSDDVKQVETLSSSVTAQSYDLTAVCRNCTTWSTGSLDTTSTSQSFMFALGPTGNSIASDSTSQDIKKHSMYKTFTFDMPQASFTGNSIPSLVGSSTSGESQEAPAEGSGPSEVYNRVHGIFMAIAFVIIFPLGVIFLRVMNNVILHGLTQALGYAFVIVGLGTGIVLSQGDYNSAHQIIGLVLFSLLAIQALGGLIHHLMYKRTGKPTIIGKVHVVLGICLLILGIVNTPLGLNLAHDSHYNKYYIIVVSILGALFLAVRFWKIWDNRKKAKKGEAKEGYAAETGMTQLSSH